MQHDEQSLQLTRQKVVSYKDTIFFMFYALLDANKQKEVLSVRSVPSVDERNKNQLSFQVKKWCHHVIQSSMSRHRH